MYRCGEMWEMCEGMGCVKVWGYEGVGCEGVGGVKVWGVLWRMFPFVVCWIEVWNGPRCNVGEQRLHDSVPVPPLPPYFPLPTCTSPYLPAPPYLPVPPLTSLYLPLPHCTSPSPALGLAFVPLGSVGVSIPAIRFTFNIYTGPGYLNAVLGIINIVLLFFVQNIKAQSFPAPTMVVNDSSTDKRMVKVSAGKACVGV